MNGRPAPQVFLRINGNPWKGTLDDGVVQQYLLTAAARGEEQIEAWINTAEAELDAIFAQVYLDPTNPVDQFTIDERIFAVVLYGDAERALECLPNAAAKADAADRHGRSNGKMVEEANFCLGDGDFAWGCNAFYKGAISAGSGLTAAQDEELAQLTLESTMDAVHGERARWLKERRRNGGSQGWYNRDNAPGEQYQLTLNPGDWLTPSLS